MQQILVEDFGEECILRTESGEAYSFQMSMYGSIIVVDVLSTYESVKVEGNVIKIKTKAEQNSTGQPLTPRLP